MEYSTQYRFGLFGARWFCAVTTGVIGFEHYRKKRAALRELDEMRGRWMRLGNSNTPPPVYDSNYKDHEKVWSGEQQDVRWGFGADPEAHGFIRDWHWAFVEIADVMGVDWKYFPGKDYGVVVVDVDGNPYDDKVSTHFMPTFKGKVIANPDPRLEGFPEVERRPWPI
jgi:hypothetical protein